MAPGDRDDLKRSQGKSWRQKCNDGCYLDGALYLAAAEETRVCDVRDIESPV